MDLPLNWIPTIPKSQGSQPCLSFLENEIFWHNFGTSHDMTLLEKLRYTGDLQVMYRIRKAPSEQREMRTIC